MEKENYYDGAVKVAEIDAITNSKCEILVNEKIDFQLLYNRRRTQ